MKVYAILLIILIIALAVYFRYEGFDAPAAKQGSSTSSRIMQVISSIISTMKAGIAIRAHNGVLFSVLN
jgi:hypothetical protein